MKKLYLTFILFFATILSFSQEEVELFGDWYLHFRTIDGETSYPPLTITEDYDIILNFSLLPPNASIPFVIESYSASHSFEGKFIVDNGIMEILNVTQYTPPCDYPTEVCDYSSNYGSDILLDPNTSIEPNVYVLSYDVTGADDEAVLTITNNSNGDLAVYGRQPTSTAMDVLGDWYLYAINVDNTTSYNQEIGTDFPNLRLTTENGSSNYEGTVCNGYNGTCTINENTIEITDLAQLLGSCESDSIEQFEQSYFYEVLTDLSSTVPDILNYQISGIGANQTLTLTNTLNSNYAVFSRQAQPTDIMGQWFLHYMNVNSNHVNPPNLTFPTIVFDDTPNAVGLYLDGSAACNGFGGDYVFNVQQTFTLNEFYPTLAICDTTEESNFEDAYFNLLLYSGNATEFDYNIEGTGDAATLVITNLSNGNQGFYGRQALSVDDVHLSSSKLKINQNPVSDRITFSEDYSNASYEIYSVSGERVMDGNIDSTSISVKALQTGLYFLKVYNTTTQFEILKFIKE